MTDCFSVVDYVARKCREGYIPFQLFIELTQRCNLKCLHCYNFDRQGGGKGSRAVQESRSQEVNLPNIQHPIFGIQHLASNIHPELTREEVFGLLEEARHLGTILVSFTGGEIFSHPYLFDFLEEAQRQHLGVNLLTNGTYLTEPRVNRLSTYDHLMAVTLSLYGASAEVHDVLTQVVGSFKRTLEGALRLKQKGIPVKMKGIIMKQNQQEVEAMIKLMEGLHIPLLTDTAITPRHDGSDTSLQTRLETEELGPLYRGSLGRVIRRRKPIRSVEDFKCNCARTMCAVTSTGSVQPCIGVPLSAGNIRENSLTSIWHSSGVFRWIRGLTWEDFSVCAPCPYKEYCRRGSGDALMVSGSFTGVDPWTCREAELIHDVYQENVAVKQRVEELAVSR